MTFLTITSVTTSYNGQPVLHDFSLEIEKGERLVILGPSGCGKTTVLRLLAGFIAPDSGSISIEGDLVAADGKTITGPEARHFGMVFQDLALWPHLSVKGNLEFGLKAKHVTKEKREQLIAEMLDLVQMSEYIHAKPGELSGGQQQRVALARALVLHPKALLMDEPLSSLDVDLNERIRKEILRLHNTLGFTLIYVTHDREEALDIGTRVLIMEKGRIERSGSVKEIRHYFERP
ncbi:MAG: ABC transporter ATP-binding protein [Candidatus Methylomirabilis oxyfera]|nr:ABC transporter ATP-binding protein [Candidatus Methylomirabilis oxyfera]